jgi:hypothetical protein
MYYTYSKPAMKLSQETISKQPIQHYPSCANFESIKDEFDIELFAGLVSLYYIQDFCGFFFETLQLVLITFSLI